MLLKGLRECFYPSKCIVCSKLLEESDAYFCEVCEQGVQRHNVCRQCGKPYADKGECPWCQEMPEGVVRIQSLFPYIDFYKESVLRWKYKGIRKYSKGFAQLIVQDLLQNDVQYIDAIVPIPIAPNRYVKRGFNQAGDLAEAVGVLVQKPVYDSLKRIRRTKPQSACTKHERRHNIRNTMVADDTMAHQAIRRILLVDDIYTTGSTIRECIRAIQQKNPNQETLEVYVITVCMG